MRRLVTVNRRDADDQPELLEDQVRQIGAEASDGQQAAGEAGDRSGGCATNGGAPHQHLRLIERLKIGSAGLEDRNFAANLLRIDLFEERPEDFFEKRVSSLFQLTDGSHRFSIRTSPRSSFPTEPACSHNRFCKSPNL